MHNPDARAHHRAEHVGDGADPLAGIEHLRLQSLPAGKGQELASQPGSAVNRVSDGTDVALAPLLRKIRSAQQVGG